MLAEPLVAVDIGNSRIKLGLFAAAGADGLPEPIASLSLTRSPNDNQLDSAALATWLDEHVPPGTLVVLGSVSRPGASEFRDLLADLEHGQWNHLRTLTAAELPIVNRTDQPDRVGVDRLAAAVAVNAVRRTDTPAIVIDFGTAVTVDLVASDGGFAGGAILPGIHMAADALHARTDALPRVEPQLEGKSPPAVGSNTAAAIHAGLYWGAVGAVRELIARQRDGLVAPPQVLVTGSTSPDMARLLGSPDYTVRYVPHLVLAGLAIAAS